MEPPSDFGNHQVPLYEQHLQQKRRKGQGLADELHSVWTQAAPTKLDSYDPSSQGNGACLNTKYRTDFDSGLFTGHSDNMSQDQMDEEISGLRNGQSDPADTGVGQAAGNITVDEMSVKQLKTLIEAHGLQFNDCIEKQHLQDRAREAMQLDAAEKVAAEKVANKGPPRTRDNAAPVQKPVLTPNTLHRLLEPEEIANVHPAMRRPEDRDVTTQQQRWPGLDANRDGVVDESEYEDAMQRAYIQGKAEEVVQKRGASPTKQRKGRQPVSALTYTC